MRTEVPKFGYVKAKSVSDAVSLLTDSAGQDRIISGGSDLLSRIKNRIETQRPRRVIDISDLGLNYIKYVDTDGLRIGATTNISDVQNDPTINQKYTVLAQAAASVATPQIRNTGTIAGDILQEVWCWYFRLNYACWRNGGTTCYGAIGDNRTYHSIFSGRLCYAVHAGDTSSALFALDADVKVAGAGGERNLSMDQLMPGINTVDGIVKENMLAFNEILTEIHVPPPSQETRGAYYKVRDRGTWDFALASTATVASFEGNAIAKARLVLGGVDVIPHRAKSAEQFLAGKQLTEDNIAQAAETALEGASPLTFGTGNAFRVDLARGSVKKALRMLSA